MKALFADFAKNLPLPADRYDIARTLGLTHDQAWFMAMHPKHARLWFEVLSL